MTKVLAKLRRWWARQAIRKQCLALRADDVREAKRAHIALVTIGDPAIALLVSELQRGEAIPRLRAAAVLGEIRTPSVVSAMATLLEDRDPEVSESAVRCLWRVGGEAAHSALRSVLQRNPNRVDVIRALGDLRDEAVVSLLLTRFGQSEDAYRLQGMFNVPAKIHDTIATALAAIGARDSTAALASRFRSHPTGAVAQALQDLGWEPQTAKDQVFLVAALRFTFNCPRLRVGPQHSGEVDHLLALLTHSDQSVRETAAEALGSIGDGRAFGPLLTAIMNGSVLNGGWCALGDLGDKRALQPMLGVLRACADGQPVPQSEPKRHALDAIEGLGRLKDPAAAETLLAVLLGKLRVPESEVSPRSRTLAELGLRNLLREAGTKVDAPVLAQIAQLPRVGLFVVPSGWKIGTTRCSPLLTRRLGSCIRRDGLSERSTATSCAVWRRGNWLGGWP